MLKNGAPDATCPRPGEHPLDLSDVVPKRAKRTAADGKAVFVMGHDEESPGSTNIIRIE